MFLSNRAKGIYDALKSPSGPELGFALPAAK